MRSSYKERVAHAIAEQACGGDLPRATEERGPSGEGQASLSPRRPDGAPAGER